MPAPIVEPTRDALVTEFVRVDGSRYRVRLSAPVAEVFRLQIAAPDGSFLEDGSAQQLARLPGWSRIAPPEELVVRRAGASIRISSPSGRGFLRVEADPTRFILCGADGSALTAISDIGRSGDISWLAGLLRADERLWGTGERFNGTNQRGKNVRIWAEDRWCQTEGNSYVPIPFVMSSAGWAMLVNRYEASAFDLGATDPDGWRVSLDHAPLDVYLFLDSTPAAALGKLGLLTGRAPLPAEWTFGVHVCRHARLKEFGTREGVMAMVREMESHRLRWSSVILEGWDTYDAAKYAELKSLVAELHAMGKKALMYEPCGRLPDPFFGHQADRPETYLEGQEARPDYFVKTADGRTHIAESAAYNPADAPNRRESSFLDITNPEAVQWWTERVWGRLVGEIGIDGAKIDFCEQFPEWDSLRFADGRSPQGMHHLYPVLYNTMMYGLYSKLRPEGGMCFSRGGSTGAHLYPFIWCGDQLREWRFLRAILSSLLSAGLSGVPFLCHDLAAYLPAKDPAANPEDRVFARGTEMGCFTVNMQTHGTVTRPYDFAPAIVDIYRLYTEIHYALVPYLREQAASCCETGLPLTRHLVLDWPLDRTAWDCEDEYLLGSSLLVAPVLDNGEARDVYLPAGRWESLFGRETFHGPRTLRGFAAPLDRIPVFVRERGESVAVSAFIAEARRLAGVR
jgi:alpha-D-xyloside xylohydrolase